MARGPQLRAASDWDFEHGLEFRQGLKRAASAWICAFSELGSDEIQFSEKNLASYNG